MRLRWLAAGAVVVAGAAAFVILLRPDPASDPSDAGLDDRIPLAEPGVEGSVVRLMRAVEGGTDPERLDLLVSRYRDGEPLSALAQIGRASCRERV